MSTRELVSVPPPGSDLDPGSEPAREWHRDLFELAGEGIFLADLAGRYVDVNKAGCSLLGYTRDELIGKTIVDLIPESEVPRLADEKQHMLTGASHVSEWRLRHKDGTFIPVEVNANILADGRWLGFVRDLRGRKAAEETARRDEQRLRVALGSAPIAMFSQDRALRVTWSYNPSPFTPEPILGKRQEELASPAVAQRLIALKRQVLDSGVPAHTLFESDLPSGRRWFDLRLEPLRGENGEIIGLTGAAWDVTERKRDEDAHRLLADASALFAGASTDWKQLLAGLAQLAIGLPCDFCIIDAFDDDGTLRRVAFAHGDPEMATRCAGLSSMVLDPGLPHLGAEVLRSSEPLLIQEVPAAYLRASAKDDGHLALLRLLEIRSVIAVPIRSRDQLFGKLLVGTSRRPLGADEMRTVVELARRAALAVDTLRLQQALQRAVQARDEALAIVAHDLRNPLNSVVLQSEILSKTIEEHSGAGLALDRIRRSAHRMNRLIQDLLDVVRLDAHEVLSIDRKDLSPDQVAAEAVDAMRPLANASLIELAAEIEPGLAAIRADRDRLLQVFDNLIGNAIKFSPRGACVTVRVARKDDHVMFSVEDNGPGLHADQVAHLFDRFWKGDRRDRRGLGLGLSVVKGIIEAHGGRIWVDSEPGKGTSFRFALPSS